MWIPSPIFSHNLSVVFNAIKLLPRQALLATVHHFCKPFTKRRRNDESNPVDG